MSKLITPVELFDVRAMKEKGAELYHGINEDHVRDTEKKWKPILDDAHDKLQEMYVSGKIDKKEYVEKRALIGLQDHHWLWREKYEYGEKRKLSYLGFAIISEGETQGLMYVDVSPLQRCRMKSQQNKEMVYVDFLATAPWNRPKLMKFIGKDSQSFSGVGSIMMEAAFSLSIHEKRKGRTGLHSLPHSIKFYTKHCGMEDLGPDIYKQGLHYLEITPEDVNSYLGINK